MKTAERGVWKSRGQALASIPGKDDISQHLFILEISLEKTLLLLFISVFFFFKMKVLLLLCCGGSGGRTAGASISQHSWQGCRLASSCLFFRETLKLCCCCSVEAVVPGIPGKDVHTHKIYFLNLLLLLLLLFLLLLWTLWQSVECGRAAGKH